MRHGYGSRAKGVSRTYSIWCGMRTRCNNPNVKTFRYYGARGIKVCARWDDYTLFLTDMGEAPEGLTIDRIDSAGSYCPENCRWLSIQQ